MSNLMVAAPQFGGFPITLTGNNETAIAVTPSYNENQQSATAQGVALWGMLNVTAGTGTTSLTLRVRQGNGTTGTIVQSAQTTGVNTTTDTYTIAVNDPTIVQQGVQYTLTAQQTGATGNGTVNGGAFFNHDADSFE